MNKRVASDVASMREVHAVRAAAMVVLATACLVLAACGSKDDGDGASTGAGGTPAAGTATERGRPSTETFEIAAAQGIASLDPGKILFSWDQVTYTLVFDALTAFDIDSGDKVKPQLAESWTASDDLKTYTFKLREGVKFSNGDDLTAEDVKDNLDRYLDEDTGWFWRTSIVDIDKVTVVDPQTVRMTLSAPSRDLPAALQIAPIVNLEGAAGKAIARKPIGSGQFTVDSFTPNGRLVLKRNREYWGKPAPSDQLTIERASDPTSAVTSLRSGQLSALWAMPWPDVKAIEEQGGGDLEVVTQDKPAAPLILEVDNTSPPFDNPKARQALSLAINRDLVLKSVYTGKGTVAAANTPIPAGHPFADTGLPKAEFNPQEAKRLFAEAGVGAGDTLTYWTPGAGQNPERLNTGQILQSDLEKIGINMKIEARELNTWAAKFAPPGKKWPGLIVPNFYTGLPAPQVSEFWNPGICECNYDNPQYTKALKDAKGAATDGERKELYGKAQQIFAKDAPVAVALQSSDPIGVRTEADGVWIDPSGQPRFDDASMGGT